MKFKSLVIRCLQAAVLSGALAAGSANATPLDLTTFSSGWDQTPPALSTNYATLTASSWISKAVTAVTSFDWFFQAQDYMPYNDYGYVTAGGSTTLASVSSVGDYGNSGWNTYVFGSAFTGTLTFGVVNYGDSFNDSQLFIKNVMTSVPEPEMLLLLLTGILGMALRKKSLNA